jgi:hypothetical protein
MYVIRRMPSEDLHLVNSKSNRESQSTAPSPIEPREYTLDLERVPTSLSRSFSGETKLAVRATVLALFVTALSL